MAQKPETTYINKVKKLLGPGVYAEKMNNPFRGGTPDVYYEGPSRGPHPGYLWVEYKYFSKTPQHFDLRDTKAQVRLSGLQQGWLSRSHNNGHPTWVIVGTPEGGIILRDREWDTEVTVVASSLKTAGEIAHAISAAVNVW